MPNLIKSTYEERYCGLLFVHQVLSGSCELNKEVGLLLIHQDDNQIGASRSGHLLDTYKYY